jgi:1,4-dihydroxy-2-naphthoate octaprenyltransferase
MEEKRETQPSQVKCNSAKAWILAARPKTLTGACIPVITASALAAADGVFHPRQALLCLLFASLMQVAANFINDLFDFLKGSDRSDRLGPERACAQGWISPKAMRTGIGVTLVVACMLGLLLLIGTPHPWLLILIGATCVVFAFLYTTLLSYRGMGDVLVWLFFGIVPVLGTYYVQAVSITTDAVIVALICGMLIDTLLVLNNYRDRETDRRDHKCTLVVLLGERFGRYYYLSLGLLAWALCIVLAFHGLIWAFVLPTVYLPLHIMTWRRMVRIFEGKALNVILGETSRNMFIFAVLLSVGLLIA